MPGGAGVAIAEDVLPAFEDFKLQRNKMKSKRYFLMKIHKGEIILVGCGDRSETFEDFCLKLMETGEPRYGVVDMPTRAGGTATKLVFVAWIPDATAKIAHKMVYAATKETLLREMRGIMVNINATDLSELDFTIDEHGHVFKGGGRLSNLTPPTRPAADPAPSVPKGKENKSKAGSSVAQTKETNSKRASPVAEKKPSPAAQNKTREGSIVTETSKSRRGSLFTKKSKNVKRASIALSEGDDILMQGQLSKLASGLVNGSKWQKRFFTASHQYLRYYKDLGQFESKPSMPRGVLGLHDLAGCEQVGECELRLRFEVTRPVEVGEVIEDEITRLRAENGEESAKWAHFFVSKLSGTKAGASVLNPFRAELAQLKAENARLKATISSSDDEAALRAQLMALFTRLEVAEKALQERQ